MFTIFCDVLYDRLKESNSADINEGEGCISLGSVKIIVLPTWEISGKWGQFLWKVVIARSSVKM